MSSIDKLVEGDDPVVITVDVVPSINQEAPVASYPDFDRARTRVITYWTGPGNEDHPRWAMTRREARKLVEATYGRVFEENHVEDKSYYRVGKAPTSTQTEGGSGGKA